MHETYLMLQSTSHMAMIQEFLTTEGCDWIFNPPHGTHFGVLWESVLKSTKDQLRRKLGFLFADYKYLCTSLADREACVNFRAQHALYDKLFNSTYLWPGHFLIGEPRTHLPAADFTDVKSIEFYGDKPTNNKCNIYGIVGHQTTSRFCNSSNAGRGPHLTYNQAISSC